MFNDTTKNAPRDTALLLFLLVLLIGCTTYDAAFKHYVTGTNLYKVGKFEEAVAEFDKSIQLEEVKNEKSKNTRNYYLMRASARNNIGDFEGAISDYTE